MRAMLSWDVDPADPQFQQIILDLGSVLPAGRYRPLSNYAGIVDPVTTRQYRDLAIELNSVADRYPQRLYFVWSLHPAGATIWGRFREPGATLLVEDDTLGFGLGDGAPGAP